MCRTLLEVRASAPLLLGSPQMTAAAPSQEDPASWARQETVHEDHEILGVLWSPKPRNTALAVFIAIWNVAWIFRFLENVQTAQKTKKSFQRSSNLIVSQFGPTSQRESTLRRLQPSKARSSSGSRTHPGAPTDVTKTPENPKIKTQR